MGRETISLMGEVGMSNCQATYMYYLYVHLLVLVCNGRQELHARRGNGKPVKIVLERCVLSRHGRGGHTILERVHFKALFVGGAHGRFHTVIGQETTKDDIFDAVLTQQEIQIRRGKATHTVLALDEQIPPHGPHAVDIISAPFSISKGFDFFYIRQDTVWWAPRKTRKDDGTMDNGATRLSCRRNGLNRSGQHVGRLHTLLDGVVEFPTW
jgi:hypothetical protein